MAIATGGCDDGDVSLGSDTLPEGQAGAGALPGAPSATTPDDGSSTPADGTNPAPGTPGTSDTGTDAPGAGTAGNADGAGSDGGDSNDGSDTSGGTDSGMSCGSRGLQPCPAGQFCNHPVSATCGETDLPGACEVLPEDCPVIDRPVCGCDGETHSNACSAAAARVSVRSEGACGGDSGSGDTCGGFIGAPCPDGEYCDYAAGDGCAIADGQGICKTRPSACTRESDPVCGCDGVSYANPCEAAAANASVARSGRCEDPAPKGCGGGALCGATQRCEGATSTACGASDGTCVDGPGACTADFAPVCGCDGKDYGNECGAITAGAGVQSTGPC